MSVLGACPACGSDWCTNCDCVRAELAMVRRERAEQQASGEAAIADLMAKIEFLVRWVDSQGLLPEHVFTFPDGDVWEATPKGRVQ